MSTPTTTPLIRSRQTLLNRQTELLRRSAELRGAIEADCRQLDRPLRHAGRLRDTMTWISTHRAELMLGLGIGATLLALRRPRAVLRTGWRWGRRAFRFWRHWRHWRPWLRPLLRRWLP